MKPLSPGRIIWEVYPGKRGGGKPRPMVVLSKRVDIVRTGKVFVVVCPTQFEEFEEPLQNDQVRLLSSPDGLVPTELKEDTIAICNWTVSLDANRKFETSGLIPSQQIRLICEKIGIPYPVER